jgi:hypothetical protein
VLVTPGVLNLASLTKHLRVRTGKGKHKPSNKSNKEHKKTLSQIPNGIELIWWLGEDPIYLICLGVESFALVLNAMFGMLGWLGMGWLVVFIAPNHFNSHWRG